MIFLLGNLNAQNIQMVKDINPNGNAIIANFKKCSFNQSMNNVVERMFFQAQDDASTGAFVSDGTAAGTIKLKALTSANYFTTLSAIGSDFPKVVFVGETSNNGKELWITKGTELTTNLLKDIMTGTNSSNPTGLVPLTYAVYFLANTSNSQRDLYKTQGTGATTTIVKAFTDTNSLAYNMYKVNNKLIFAAYTLQYGAELWVSDGTEAGTVLLKDIYTGTNSAFPIFYGAINFSGIEYNGKFFFSAANNNYNYEPWYTDGTTSGTLCLKEINANGGSSPQSFVVCNNMLYFIAYDGTNYGIYQTDGTSNNTTQIATVNNGYYKLYAYKNNLYFYDNTGKLCKVNLTTNQIEDIMQFNSDPYSTFHAYEYNDYLYFRVYRNSQYELWRTDGTTQGTMQLLPSGATKSGNPILFGEYNGSLYMSADFDNNGNELWKLTDSTSILPPTFELVSDINIYPNPAYDIVNIKSLTSKYFYIYDIMGKNIMKIENKGNSIIVSQIPSGLYMVRDENGNYIGKFIKQ